MTRIDGLSWSVSPVQSISQLSRPISETSVSGLVCELDTSDDVSNDKYEKCIQCIYTMCELTNVRYISTFDTDFAAHIQPFIIKTFTINQQSRE